MDMKKLLSIIISICLLVNIFPLFVFAAELTPEISLEEFASQLKALQEQYDEDYVGEIVFENDSDFYHVDGELFPLENEEGEVLTASVSKDSIDVPLSVLAENSIEATENDILEVETKTSQKSRQTKNTQSVEDYASTLGYDVEINDDTAVFTQPYQTHRLIVKSKYNIDPLDSVAMVEGYNDLHIVQFDDKESTQDALEYYESQKRIDYVELDLVLSTAEFEDFESSDTENYFMGINYGSHLSWGSEMIGIDDYVDYLDNTQTYPEIVVAVIDTGVELDHEFLEGRIIETGFNVSDSGTVGSENDDHGHGTHVSGIIVDNTTDNVKIKGYKVLNNSGSGTISSICLGIDQATADGVNVINMSLGGQGTSETMTIAIQNAVAQGITVCVAAGNSAANAAYFIPAGIEECITVGAIDKDYAMPFFSNYGEILDILAPGVSIKSSFLNNTYELKSGTSMASPFVAAASAMLLTSDPTMNSDEVLELLLENGVEGPYFEYFLHKLNLYIGDISSFGRVRTAQPQFSIAPGKYYETITVELTCPEDANIYYTINGKRASATTGTLYTGPITISKTRKISAVAVTDGKMKSLQAYGKYYIRTMDPESNFEIDTSGIITAYNGVNGYLTIPDTINGITVTGIGDSVFYADPKFDIKLPDTLTYIGDKAFYYNPALVTVEAKNIKHVGDHAFWKCSGLEEFDFSTLEEVEQYAFYGCENVPEVYNDKLTVIEKCAFSDMHHTISFEFLNAVRVETWGLKESHDAELINLPKVEYLGKAALGGCQSVKHLYFPNLIDLDSNGSQFAHSYLLEDFYAPKFEGTIPNSAFYDSGVSRIVLLKAESISQNAFQLAHNVELLYIPNVVSINAGAFSFDSSSNNYDPSLTIFAPKAQSIKSIPKSEGVTFYCSELLNDFPNQIDIDINIISPLNSTAYNWAITNGKTAIDSLSLINALGENIRAYDNGLRFNYSWNEIEELNECAESISYSFEYSCSGSVYQPEATNKVFHSDTDTSSFNLVLSNIPNDKKDSQITARAVINIDGMIFKSPIQQCTYNDVYSIYSASINRNDINRDGFVNEDDIDLLVQMSAGINSSRSNIADVNNDGVVDGFDAAQLDRTVVSESFIYLDDDNDNTLGDVNTDGTVDVADYAMVKQHVLCDTDLNGTSFSSRTEDNTIDYPTKQVVCLMLPYMLADVDRDSAVDAFDLFRIDKRINNLA